LYLKKYGVITNYQSPITIYFKDLPQEGQNWSVTSTGLPHEGQNPADLLLCCLRRAAIIASISSSLSSDDLEEESARLAAAAFSMRDSASRAEDKIGSSSSSLRRISEPFFSRLARCSG
jgi:hypothetical protein